MNEDAKLKIHFKHRNTFILRGEGFRQKETDLLLKTELLHLMDV